MEDTPPPSPWQRPDDSVGPGQGGRPGYGTAPGPDPAPGYAPVPGYEPAPGPEPVRPGYQQPPPVPAGWDAPAAAAGWGAPAPGWGAPAPGYGATPQRPKPGIIPLRPISLGEMYDGGFQAMRTNPRTMIGISAVVIAITTLLSLAPQTAAMVSLTRFGESAADSATTGGPTGEDFAALGAAATGLLVGGVLQWIGVTILTGLLIVAVSEAVLGRRIGPGQLWQRAKGRVWALLGLTLLSGILLGLALLLVVLIGIGLAVTVHPAVGVLLGLVVGVVVGPRLYVGWSMAGPALLLEGQSVIGALRRSWALTRGSFWRVFGILILTAIIVAVASALIVAPLALVSAVIAGTAGGTPGTGVLVIQQVVQQLGSGVAGAIFYPFQAAVSALLYIDLRMRREGLDVELIRASEGARG